MVLNMSAIINLLILVKWKTFIHINLHCYWLDLLLFAAESIFTNKVLCNVIEVSNIIKPSENNGKFYTVYLLLS